MATEDCSAHHSRSFFRRKIFCCVICPIIIFIFISLFGILLFWAILRPSKPLFEVEDVSVITFNISGNPFSGNPPNNLTSSFQITLSSTNPNDKIGIHYDSLDVYAYYRNQQITFPTSILSTYQGHKEVNEWSFLIGGNSVPIAQKNAWFLDKDQRLHRLVKMVLHIDGRVRWKVGTVTTGNYDLHVRCPAYFNFGNNLAGMGTRTCSVSL